MSMFCKSKDYWGWGVGRDTQGVWKGMPGTRVRTVLRQLTPPPRIGSEIKISRVKLSRSWVDSPPLPHPDKKKKK